MRDLSSFEAYPITWLMGIDAAWAFLFLFDCPVGPRNLSVAASQKYATSPLRVVGKTPAFSTSCACAPRIPQGAPLPSGLKSTFSRNAFGLTVFGREP